MFQLAGPRGEGSGSPTPATLYASNVNPALTDAGATAPTAPKAPAVPAVPGKSNLLGPGGMDNPFLKAIQQYSTG